METLLVLDRQLFLLINGLLHPPLADSLALFFSGVGRAGFIWFVIALFVFIREEKKDRWFFAPFLLTGGLSYFVSEIFIKPLVGRIRPLVEMGAIIVDNQSTDPSFPSGHATIAFAMAVVLTNKEPKWKWIFYTLAIAIAWSRIYLGNHYPLDVIVGGLLGWSIGKISLPLVQLTHRKE